MGFGAGCAYLFGSLFQLRFVAGYEGEFRSALA